jgi:NADH-quinone oxidoreductase subunit H
MRAVAQLVSYEVPQVLATVPVVLWAGSLSLVTIFDKQLEYGWFLFSPPGLVSFVILLIANIAEVNRTPFDLPEAESEIIAGYHTEYSGMRFGLFFLAEYLSVFGVSCLGTILFLGGGAPLPFSDFPTGMLGSKMFSYVLVNLVLVSVFALKVGGFVFLMFWIRATLPRMRVDRLMNFAWKYLVPMSIVNILAAAVWYECYFRSPRPFVLFGTPLQFAFVPMNWIISSLITTLILVPAFLAIVAINRRERPAQDVVAAPATLPPAASRLPAAG